MRWVGILVVCAFSSIGCAKFDGEWLEVAPLDSAGLDSGYRRSAIKFEPPSMVRSGFFVEKMGVVDGTSVQVGSYYLYDGWKVAQIGAMTARVKGDQMIATVADGPERHFQRVKGKSIFPPRVTLPSWGAVTGSSPIFAVSE